MFLTFVTVMFRILEYSSLGFLRKSLWGFPEEQIQLALATSFLSSRSLASAISRARLWDLYILRASPWLGFPRLVLLRLSSALFLAVLSLPRFAPLAFTWTFHVCCAKLYMFVVVGHLYRLLLLSQSLELGGQILGGFGIHPLRFFCAGLSILMFF